MDSLDFQKVTLQNLFDAGGNREGLASTLAFVARTENLGTARDRMRAKANCNDVFVTATGLETEPVEGWLTDMLLATVSQKEPKVRSVSPAGLPKRFRTLHSAGLVHLSVTRR